MGDLHIRPARDSDLGALVEELGQRPFFADRLARQANGRGLLLTAWQKERPIGDVYLWLEPAEEPEIREHLPRTPLLTHLEVHREHREQGVGTELLKAAEQELTSRAHTQVALAVETDKERVLHLYHRLGYREWPHPPIRCYAPADGNGNRRAEICRIMFKRLA